MTLYHVHVRLADNEWGNELMDRAAREAAKHYRENRPLLVTVQEHAGWFLVYWFDGEHIEGMIVGTANDSAVFNALQESARRRIEAATWLHLPGITRVGVQRDETGAADAAAVLGGGVSSVG